jgi:hypothetical protein
VVEEKVVHLPEGVLLAGRLGGLRGELGARMDVVQRQVPPDVADVAEIAPELAKDRLGHPTVRTLEVAVLDDRDGGFGRPADVVALGIDVEIEVGELLRGAEQRAQAKPSREKLGGAEEEPCQERCAEGCSRNSRNRSVARSRVERSAE